MRKGFILILLLLAGLPAACRAADPQPRLLPTLSSTAEAIDNVEAEAGPSPAAEARTHCTEVDPHPLGQSISEKFNVSYEWVMRTFCSGHTFDEILMALQTSKISERSPDELFAMRQNQSWEQIWAELDIVEP